MTCARWKKPKSASLKPCLSCTVKRSQEATATWPVARCSTGGEGSVAGRSARISKPAEFAGSECVCCQAGWACRSVQLVLYDYTSTSRDGASCAAHRSRGARCKPEGTLRTLKPCCTACANQAQPGSYGRSSFCMPCSACMPGTARRGWWRCCRQRPQIGQEMTFVHVHEKDGIRRDLLTRNSCNNNSTAAEASDPD